MTTLTQERQTIELAEYQTVRRQCSCAPTPVDLALAERLRGRDQDPRLEIRWLTDGTVEIRSASWVGSVQFSGLEVKVVPKLVGGSLKLLRMIEYASGVDLLRRLQVERDLPGQGHDLFDLICQVLAAEARWLLRDGLLRDYRVEEETLEVLRGRLRHRDQYLKRFGRLDRLDCRFDEYDSDTPLNQLVAAGLAAARLRAVEPKLRAELTKLHGMYIEACTPPPAPVDFYERAISYDRRNGRYRPAHEISKLILRGLSFEDIYGRSEGRIAAFMLDMNVVFEAFVSRLVEDALQGTGYSVKRQTRLGAVVVNDNTGRTYTRIRPDLVVGSPGGGQSVPLDIKYKTYELKKISAADIYQTFLYAYALGRSPADRRAVIIYPSEGRAGGHRLSVRSIDRTVTARIVGLAMDLPSILELLPTARRNEALAGVRSTILQFMETSTTV